MTLTEMAEHLRWCAEEIEAGNTSVTPEYLHNFSWQIVEATRQEHLVSAINANIEKEYDND